MPFSYDSAGRPDTQTLDGGVVADAAYDADKGELTGVGYPAGTGNAGNGTALAVDAIRWGAPRSTPGR